MKPAVDRAAVVDARFVMRWVTATFVGWTLGFGLWSVASAAGMAAPLAASDIARAFDLAMPYSLPAFVAAGGLRVGLPHPE